MIDLERALTDLAGHLDYPAGEHRAHELRSRLLAGERAGRRRRALLAAAAVFALVSVGVIGIPPARHAVADWLGIGAVEVRRSNQPAPPAPSTKRTVPGAPGSLHTPNAVKDLAAARRVVRFHIAIPPRASSGALAGVVVDERVPGGLVALAYERFTLVEIATDVTQPPLLAKLVGGAAAVQHVTVNGRPGLWIGAVHEIGYIDRSGNFETDTVRRSGPVLIWERAGVTYRIEGLRARAEALAVARTIA